MILVSEAGWRAASAFCSWSTRPVLTSMTMEAGPERQLPSSAVRRDRASALVEATASAATNRTTIPEHRASRGAGPRIRDIELLPRLGAAHAAELPRFAVVTAASLSKLGKRS